MKNAKNLDPEENSLYLNSSKDFRPNKNDDYGYFFFPERFGQTYKPKWYEKLISLTGLSDEANKAQCERNVQQALEHHPGVKLLAKAMKSVGCEVNLLRHFSVEHCDEYVKGGFDPSTNQIILCHNRVFEYDDCVEILSHELIHAFDYCRANLDVSNKLHVACSEIRAANLTSCSFFDSIQTVGLTLRNIRRECVRQKAALSLQTVRNITEKEALDAVDTVFEKCYNDLEPFGRRIYSKEDCERAYKDRKFYGLD